MEIKGRYSREKTIEKDFDLRRHRLYVVVIVPSVTFTIIIHHHFRRCKTYEKISFGEEGGRVIALMSEKLIQSSDSILSLT